MGTTYHIRVPAGKQLVLDIAYSGHKEQALQVEIGGEIQDYLRNNVEAEQLERGRYRYSRSYGPWNEDQDVYLEGQSKNCYVGDKCAAQPWWPGIRRVEKESATSFHVWWDEGANPPVNKHIDVKGKIKKPK